MSHFVQIRTQLQERSMVLAALQDLGFAYEEAPAGEPLLPVRGDRNEPERAEIVVHAAPETDIGLRLKDGVYEIVADWYRMEQSSPLRRTQFVEDLTRRYAYHVVLDQAKEQNLIVEDETQENGDIVMVLSERG
jgi:hypothetical protein